MDWCGLLLELIETLLYSTLLRIAMDSIALDKCMDNSVTRPMQLIKSCFKVCQFANKFWEWVSSHRKGTKTLSFDKWQLTSSLTQTIGHSTETLSSRAFARTCFSNPKRFKCSPKNASLSKWKEPSSDNRSWVWKRPVSDWISNEESNDFLSLWFNQQDFSLLQPWHYIMPEAYADLCRPHLYSDWQRRTRTHECHHLSVQTANYAAKGPKFNPFLRELDKYNFGEGQLLAYVGFALLHRTP